MVKIERHNVFTVALVPIDRPARRNCWDLSLPTLRFEKMQSLIFSFDFLHSGMFLAQSQWFYKLLSNCDSGSIYKGLGSFCRTRISGECPRRTCIYWFFILVHSMSQCVNGFFILSKQKYTIY